MKALFIINPVSGTKTFQSKLDKFIGRIILNTSTNTVDTYYTKEKNDAYNKASTLTKSDYDYVVAVGGDGTVNEVISGIVKSESHIPLAIIPGGTVNDFATYLSLPKTPHKFTEMINRFTYKEVDVGTLNNYCFANVISGGMFSDIGFQVSREEKNTFGPLAYYYHGVSQLPAQLSISLHLKVTADDHTFEEDASLFLIANSSSVGGFRDIASKAHIDDGFLDLFIIKKCNVAELINLLKDYRFNIHLNNPLIHYVQAKHIIIECDEDIIYDIDGEQGEGFPIDVSCINKAIKILI